MRMQNQNIQKIQSVTQLHSITPNKMEHRSEIKPVPFSRNSQLIRSTATQFEVRSNRGTANNSLEKYYETNFQVYQSRHQSGNNSNDKERLFHAKLKILAVMKKLNIYYSDRINFAQITIQQAIQQLYLQTKDHIHCLQQKIQSLTFENQKFYAFNSKQKIKQLHLEEEMQKVSQQLRELDQIKLLKNLNMQYLQQLKHLMEDLHAKQIQIEDLKEQLIQRDTMIKVQQDGVDNLINREGEMVNSLNGKIERLKDQRVSLRKEVADARVDIDRLRKEVNNLEKNNQILKISLQNQRNQLQLANQAQQQLKTKFREKQQDMEKEIKLLNEKGKVQAELCDKKQNTIQTLKKQIKQWMNFQKERDVKHNEQIQMMKGISTRQIEKLTEEVRIHEQSIYQKQKIIFQLQQVEEQLIKKGEQSQHKQQALTKQIKEINQKYNYQVNQLLNQLTLQRKLNQANCDQIQQQNITINHLNAQLQHLFRQMTQKEAQAVENDKIQKQFFEKQICSLKKKLEEQVKFFQNQVRNMKLQYEALRQNKSESEAKLSFQIQQQKQEIYNLDNYISQLKSEHQRIVDQLSNKVESLKKIKDQNQVVIRSNQAQIERITGDYSKLVQLKKELIRQKAQQVHNMNINYQKLSQQTTLQRMQLQQIIRERQLTVERLQQDIMSQQKHVRLLNIAVQEGKQELISQIQDHQSKQKRFNQTLDILRKRNNQLNIKYQQELKNRDKLEGRYYQLEKENNQKIDKLTNQLSQVTVMIQKQHVPRGNFSKLQQFQSKIMDLQIRLSEAQTQSNQLRDLLEQKESKIEQLETWTKSSKIFSEK